MAIENNADLAASRFDPAISAERVAAARSAFLPTLSTALQRNSQTDAVVQPVLRRSARSHTEFWSGDAAVGQLLPWGGGTYDVSFNSARTTTTNPLTTFTPSLTSSIQAVFSQPLLRNFKTDRGPGAARR